jgi:sulfur relay protein TusB/DsrH
MKLGVFVSDYTQTSDVIGRLKADKLGMIFVLNGVYHAALKENGKSSALLEKTKNLYVLSEDLKCRGIAESALDKRVKVVTYNDVVDLVFNEYEQLAWI